jgi:hypothetical protein
MPKHSKSHRKPKDGSRKRSITLPKLEKMLAQLGKGPSCSTTHVHRIIVGNFRNLQNGATSAYALYFTLNDLYDVTELTSLYDLYRFKKVRVEFKPTSNAIPNATTPPVGMLLAAVDLDDSTVPTLSSISQYEQIKTAVGYQGLRFQFEPRYATAGDAGGNYLVAANLPGTWIDCAYPNVIHRGIKYFLTAATAAAVSGWQIIIHYDLEFARQR